jgi:hypothetical protein
LIVTPAPVFISFVSGLLKTNSKIDTNGAKQADDGLGWMIAGKFL